jgi:hypothetical protein
MESKGELAAVMAKRLARQSVCSDTSHDSMSSMDLGLSVEGSDENGPAPVNRSPKNGSNPEIVIATESSAAKNFFKARDQEIATRRASIGQEEIMRKEKEDAKKEALERAEKKKSFQQRMAMFDTKK